MISYRAPNPAPQKKSFFNSMFSPLSSKSIGKMILPAQARSPSDINVEEATRLTADYPVEVTAGVVETYDGAVLETMAIAAITQINKPVSDQYYIVKFNGNGMQFTDALEQYAHDASQLHCTVVGFNYRGVGNSKKIPERFQDLVTDGIAEVQRLVDAGVNPHHITLDGISLGGGVATMVASYFHLAGVQVYLWNDRSLSSLSATAARMLAPNLNGAADDIVGALYSCSSWSIMKPVGWDADVASAYAAIPAEFKGYMVVAKESAASVGDGVIPHKASLHRGVRAAEKAAHAETGHKVLAVGFYHGGHNMQRAELISKANSAESGQDLFENFVLQHRR